MFILEWFFELEENFYKDYAYLLDESKNWEQLKDVVCDHDPLEYDLDLSAFHASLGRIDGRYTYHLFLICIFSLILSNWWTWFFFFCAYELYVVFHTYGNDFEDMEYGFIIDELYETKFMEKLNFVDQSEVPYEEDPWVYTAMYKSGIVDRMTNNLDSFYSYHINDFDHDNFFGLGDYHGFFHWRNEISHVRFIIREREIGSIRRYWFSRINPIKDKLIKERRYDEKVESLELKASIGYFANKESLLLRFKLEGYNYEDKLIFDLCYKYMLFHQAYIKNKNRKIMKEEVLDWMDKATKSKADLKKYSSYDKYLTYSQERKYFYKIEEPLFFDLIENVQKSYSNYQCKYLKKKHLKKKLILINPHRKAYYIYNNERAISWLNYKIRLDGDNFKESKRKEVYEAEQHMNVDEFFKQESFYN